MKPKKEDREITLRGIITIADWDSDNNIIAFSLCTPGEIDYRITNNGKRKEFLSLLGEEVKVRGIVHEDTYGKKMITINKYETIKTDYSNTKKKGKHQKDPLDS
ncbi:MAG: hypothetical protein ACMUIP_06210 [bacterium]